MYAPSLVEAQWPLCHSTEHSFCNGSFEHHPLSLNVPNVPKAYEKKTGPVDVEHMAKCLVATHLRIEVINYTMVSDLVEFSF